jgi:alpha-2-macroglobulin-like protein
MTDSPFREESSNDSLDVEGKCDAYFHGLLYTDEADALLALTKTSEEAADAFEKARRRFEALQSLPHSEPSDRLLKATIAHVEQGVVQLQRRSYWRKMYLASVSLAAVAAAVVIGAFQYHYKTLEASPFDLRVLGQSEFLAGGPASFRLGLFNTKSNKLVSNAPVKLTLVDAKRNVRQELASFNLGEGGSASPPVAMPDWAPGEYQLEIRAETAEGEELLTQPIQLERSFKIMLSTDKPVYKPGQTIRLRGLALRKPDLKPFGDQEAIFTLTDPAGNLIFKHRVKTSEFGLCSADCALADEIEEGGYKAAIQIGDTTSERTVEVQRYVLPKFKIDSKLDKSFYAPGDNVKVDFNIGYFFGQPVAEGTIKLKALSDAAGAQEIASAEVKTDAEGKATLNFQIPDYLVGSPANNGDAKVQMFFNVTDSAGQTQNASASRTITSRPLQITIAPEAGQLIGGVKNRVYVVVTYADGRPCAGAKIKVNDDPKEITANELGVAIFENTPPAASGHTTASFTILATDTEGKSVAMSQAFLVNASMAGSPFIVRLDKSIYAGGDTINLDVIGSGVEPVFIDFIKDGQTQLTTLVEMKDGSGKLALDLPPELFGTLEVVAYRFNQQGFPVHQVRPIVVQQADQLKITTTLDRGEYLPGADAKLRFQLADKEGKPVVGALSLAVVDEAVFSVLDQAPGMEQVFFLLEQELLKPVATLYAIPPTPNGFPGDVSPERLAARKELEQAAFSLASWINNPNEPTNLVMVPTNAGVIPEIRNALNQSNLFSINLESLTSKKVLIEQVRKIGIERIMIAWACLVSAIVLVSVGSFAVMQPRAFLISAAVTFVVGLLVSPVIGILVATSFHASEKFASREMNGMDFATAEAMPPPMAVAPRSADMDGAMGGMPLPGAEKFAEAEETKSEGADAKGVADPAVRGQAPAPPRIRRWFPETLLWRPELVTDENGVATLDITPLADSITTWRLSASAVSKEGSLGSSNQPIKVFQTFFVDVNTPVALTRNDQVGVPIVVYNYLNEKQTVSLDVASAGWFERTDGTTDSKLTLDLGPGEVRSLTLPIRALHVGKHELQITAMGGTVADAIRKEIEVDPEGKKYEIVSSGTLTEPQQFSVVAPPEAVPGSVKAIVKLYPSSFSQLVEGLDNIFQMPSGCFEQTSSTTYPNILALDYLRRTKKSVPEVEAKARQYIHLGYQRLLSFEIKNGTTPSGGFDWFGNPPANRVLTAYGLMEFEDMAKVHDIDPNLIARTRRWLLSQRQPDGTWKADHGLHEGQLGSGYEQMNKDATLLTTAYVAWAVFGGQGSSDQGATATYLRAQKPELIEDPYTLAVMIAALASMDDKATELKLLTARLDSLKKTDATGKRVWWEKPNVEGREGFRPFYGNGDAGTIETTAMAALSLLKVGGQPASVRGALTWLVEKKDARGTWHSTQATILALKALLEGTGAALGGDKVREIEIAIDGTVSRKVTIPVDQSDVMQFIDLSDEVASGKQSLSLKELTDTGTVYQVIFRYHAPETDQQIASTLAVDVEYDRAKLKVEDLVTAKATVSNRGTEAAPMIMVDLPIPPGFALETAGMDKLQAAGTIAKYQLTPRQAIVYVRELPAGASLTLEYQLRATMPVKVQVAPAEVYEYYDPAKRARGKASNLEADAA